MIDGLLDPSDSSPRSLSFPAAWPRVWEVVDVMSILIRPHRRSLSLAVETLLLSVLLVATSHIFYAWHFPSRSVWAFVLPIVPLGIGLGFVVYAFGHLIRDFDRGYSKDRCSVAAVILLGAFLVLFWYAFRLAGGV